MPPAYNVPPAINTKPHAQNAACKHYHTYRHSGPLVDEEGSHQKEGSTGGGYLGVRSAARNTGVARHRGP